MKIIPDTLYLVGKELKFSDENADKIYMRTIKDKQKTGGRNVKRNFHYHQFSSSSSNNNTSGQSIRNSGNLSISYLTERIMKIYCHQIKSHKEHKEVEMEKLSFPSLVGKSNDNDIEYECPECGTYIVINGGIK